MSTHEPRPASGTRAQQRVRTEAVWDQITALSTLVLAIITFGAVVFAALQVYELREEARIQHLVEQLRRFDDVPFVAVRKGLAVKRMDPSQEHLRPLDPEDVPPEMQDALNFCVDLGLLTKRGALDRHDVWSEFGYWLLPMYADARPYVDTERKEDGPATYKECSELTESILPFEIKEDAGSIEHPDQNQILDLYSGEVEAEPNKSTRRAQHAKQ
jgi:hypothetical protein